MMEGSFAPTYKDLTDPEVVKEILKLGRLTRSICEDHADISFITWKDGTTSWPDGSTISNEPPPIHFLPAMTNEELEAYKEKTKCMADCDATLPQDDASRISRMRKTAFDATQEYLTSMEKYYPGKYDNKHLVVFEKPLTKKQWRKMAKKYGIVIASKIWEK